MHGDQTACAFRLATNACVVACPKAVQTRGALKPATPHQRVHCVKAGFELLNSSKKIAYIASIAVFSITSNNFPPTPKTTYGAAFSHALAQVLLHVFSKGSIAQAIILGLVNDDIRLVLTPNILETQDVIL